MPMRPRSGRAFEMRQKEAARASLEGFLNSDDVHALWVHARHHMLDRRVLAGGVHRLQDDE